MTSIIRLVETIYRNQCSRNILKNKKRFLNFFFDILKSILKFKHFLKTDVPHSWCISGVTGSEKRG